MAQKILSFVAVALGGIALLVSLLSSSSPPPPPVREVAAADGAAAADVQELRERITSLEESLLFQARRINMLEAAQRGGSPVAADGSAAPPAAASELARLRDDVHSLMVGEAVNSESGREHLKEAVRSVQEEMRQEQRQRRQQQVAEAMEQADATREQRWKDFARSAGLDYQQEQTVLTAVNAEAEKRKALMQQVQSGEKSRRELRPEMRALRDATEQQVKAVLSDEQWQQFQQAQREERQSMRGFGGFGGGGERGGEGGGRGARRQ